MKNELLDDCIEAEEARLYDFVNSCKVIERKDIPTIGISKSMDLVVNRDFYNENKKYIIGLLLHESLHVYFDHINTKYPNKRLANVAQDIIINDMVMTSGYGIPEGGCTYESVGVPRILTTSLDIYNWLLENADKIDQDMLDELEKQHNIDDGEEEQPQQEQRQEILEKVFGIAQDLENKIYEDKVKKYELPQKREFIKSINKILGNFLRPDFTRTFTRQRRYCVEGTILPATRGLVRKPSISIYLDISGSMEGCNIDKAMGVLLDLKVTLASYKCSYFTFNTATESVKDYKNISVGGGTQFNNFSDKDGSDVVLIITDCEFDFNFISAHNRKKVILLNVAGRGQKIDNCEVFAC